jgi:hypothetical protein
MKLALQSWSEQQAYWPSEGRHILAQFDDDSIVVYQAYNPAIGHHAAEHGSFGGGFSYERMSWIKPNFLWMMYRSGWGTKAGQEVTLAIRIRREGFERILADAIHSKFIPELHADERTWKHAMAGSDVRLQWDPDHAPGGAKLQRRAIQLGLRGETLRRFAGEWLVEITDISGFVAEQRRQLGNHAGLVTPRERVFVVGDLEVTSKLGLARASPVPPGC